LECSEVEGVEERGVGDVDAVVDVVPGDPAFGAL